MSNPHHDPFVPKRGLDQIAEALAIGDWDTKSLTGLNDFVYSRPVLGSMDEVIADCLEIPAHVFEQLDETDVIQAAKRYFAPMTDRPTQIDSAALSRVDYKKKRHWVKASWHVALFAAKIIEYGEQQLARNPKCMAWFPRRMEHKVVFAYVVMLFLYPRMVPHERARDRATRPYCQALMCLKYYFRCHKCGTHWQDYRPSLEAIREHPQICSRCPLLEEGELVEF